MSSYTQVQRPQVHSHNTVTSRRNLEVLLVLRPHRKAEGKDIPGGCQGDPLLQPCPGKPECVPVIGQSQYGGCPSGIENVLSNIAGRTAGCTWGNPIVLRIVQDLGQGFLCPYRVIQVVFTTVPL